MDRIVLEGLAFFGRHGVLPAERTLGAVFTVDIELGLDLAAAGRTDDLAQTLDYRLAHEAAREVVEGEPLNLIEAVAERIASRLLALERVETVTVRVHKSPALGGPFKNLHVELTRHRGHDA